MPRMVLGGGNTGEYLQKAGIDQQRDIQIADNRIKAQQMALQAASEGARIAMQTDHFNKQMQLNEMQAYVENQRKDQQFQFMKDQALVDAQHRDANLTLEKDRIDIAKETLQFQKQMKDMEIKDKATARVEATKAQARQENIMGLEADVKLSMAQFEALQRDPTVSAEAKNEAWNTAKTAKDRLSSILNPKTATQQAGDVLGAMKDVPGFNVLSNMFGGGQQKAPATQGPFGQVVEAEYTELSPQELLKRSEQAALNGNMKEAKQYSDLAKDKQTFLSRKNREDIEESNTLTGQTSGVTPLVFPKDAEDDQKEEVMSKADPVFWEEVTALSNALSGTSKEVATKAKTRFINSANSLGWRDYLKDPKNMARLDYKIAKATGEKIPADTILKAWLPKQEELRLLDEHVDNKKYGQLLEQDLSFIKERMQSLGGSLTREGVSENEQYKMVHKALADIKQTIKDKYKKKIEALGGLGSKSLRNLNILAGSAVTLGAAPLSGAVSTLRGKQDEAWINQQANINSKTGSGTKWVNQNVDYYFDKYYKKQLIESFAKGQNGATE